MFHRNGRAARECVDDESLWECAHRLKILLEEGPQP